MKDLVAGLELIASDAGRLIADIRAQGIDVMAKGDGSPVTQADERAEALILERLAQSWPEIPVVAEELASSEGCPEGVGRRFFLVDPLDGTKEFIKRGTDFTVNIALWDARVPFGRWCELDRTLSLTGGSSVTAARRPKTDARNDESVDEECQATRCVRSGIILSVWIERT